MKKIKKVKLSDMKETLKFKFWLKLAIYFVLVCVSFVYLKPIFRIISLTFMSGKDVIDPSVDWLPKRPSINNLIVASKVLNLKTTLFNSLWFSSLLAIGQTLIAALTGFALSRYKFKFKNVWFMLILLAFILPVPLLMIPRIIIFLTGQSITSIKLFGTTIPQILMAFTGQGVNSTILILIFYNFFNLIPYSLDEAAMIDGASPGQVFIQIAMKLSSTTVFVVFLFAFVWNWNETYITGTLLGTGLRLLPAQLNAFDSMFAAFATGVRDNPEFKLNEAYKMAATLISITPLLILYGFVQKQFIQGIENTGITGE